MQTNGRIEEVDIMRGIGIILVVIGHMGINSAIFRFIYAFHMPLFFFISGITYKEKRIVDNLNTLILPYAVGGLATLALYATFNKYDWSDIMNDLRGLGGGCSADNFYFTPNPALWFLPCMFMLRLIDKTAKKFAGGGHTNGSNLFWWRSFASPETFADGALGNRYCSI